MDCAEYEQRAAAALSRIAALSFRLRLNPAELHARRPQIRAMRNTLRLILDEPSDEAMHLLEDQLDNASLNQPIRTTIN